MAHGPLMAVALLGWGLAGDVPAGDQQVAANEFFMVDAAEQATPADPLPPAPQNPTADQPYYPAPAPSGAPVAPPNEFFMRDDAAWSAGPMYEADSMRGAASNTVLPRRYFDGTSDWGSIPPSYPTEQHEGFGSFLNDASCGCQQRWVNWRHGTEHLEGCFPEGFIGLPIIRSTWPTVRYNGPLNPSAPIEPGGTSQNLAQKAGLATKPISALGTNIAVTDAGAMPDEGLPSLAEIPYERSHVPGTQRAWEGMAYYWDASHLIHQPLYFEDLNLERYGYSYGCAQPFVSAARFFGRIPLLPYALTVHPHYKAEYALGYGRPGSPTPYVQPVPPLSAHGAAVEAGVVTGLFFLIP